MNDNNIKYLNSVLLLYFPTPHFLSAVACKHSCTVATFLAMKHQAHLPVRKYPCHTLIRQSCMVPY